MNNQSGQVAPLAIGLALMVVAVTGLAVDVTKAFLLRRSLQNVADAAVLAGAGALDRDAYYSSGGSEVILAPDRAEKTAREVVSLRGLPVRTSIHAGLGEVRVSLRGRATTLMLRLLGIEHLEVGADAAAAPGVGPEPP